MSLESSEYPESGFEAYQNSGGSLTEETYNAIMAAHYSEEDYAMAMRVILPHGLPDPAFVEMAAKIVHVLGHTDQRITANAAGWLLPETYIFLRRL